MNTIQLQIFSPLLRIVCLAGVLQTAENNYSITGFHDRLLLVIESAFLSNVTAWTGVTLRREFIFRTSSVRTCILTFPLSLIILYLEHEPFVGSFSRPISTLQRENTHEPSNALHYSAVESQL